MFFFLSLNDGEVSSTNLSLGCLDLRYSGSPWSYLASAPVPYAVYFVFYLSFLFIIRNPLWVTYILLPSNNWCSCSREILRALKIYNLNWSDWLMLGFRANAENHILPADHFGWTWCCFRPIPVPLDAGGHPLSVREGQKHQEMNMGSPGTCLNSTTSQWLIHWSRQE